MSLTERKKNILRIVVDDYINTATPISSQKIHKEHLKELSPATIRNELSVLEDMGYLSQPYPSSGRVPTENAYKLYVNELMQKETLTPQEVDYIAGYFENQIIKVEDLVKSAAKLISDMTNYTAVATVPNHSKGNIISDVKIIKVTAKTSLVVIVFDNETIRDSALKNPQEIDDAAIESANTVLAKMFRNQPVDTLIVNEELIENEFTEFRYLFKSVINVIKEYVSERETDIICEGQAKILQYPEYNDLEKAKQFFEVMDSKKLLMSMFSDGAEQGDLEVKINIGGRDDIKGIPADCSVVTASYMIGDKNLGSAGVIGPSRMNYGKVVSVLDNVGNVLSSIAQKNDADTANKKIKNESGK